MNLPALHDAALPPKALRAALVMLRDEASGAGLLLDEAINEIHAPRK